MEKLAGVAEDNVINEEACSWKEGSGLEPMLKGAEPKQAAPAAKKAEAPKAASPKSPGKGKKNKRKKSPKK